MRSSPCRYAFLDAPGGSGTSWRSGLVVDPNGSADASLVWPFVWAGRWRPGVMVRGTGSGTRQAKRPGHAVLPSTEATSAPRTSVGAVSAFQLVPERVPRDQFWRTASLPPSERAQGMSDPPATLTE